MSKMEFLDAFEAEKLTKQKWEQAGAELGQAQIKLELGFTLIKI